MKTVKIGLLFIILAIFGCSNDKFDVDISKIRVNIHIRRLEKDIFGQSKENIKNSLPRLQQQYGSFLETYSQKVLNIGPTSEPQYPSYLYDFVSHRNWTMVYKNTMEKYPNLDQLEKELSTSFRYCKYYLPEIKIPNFYSCISGFNYRIFTDQDNIGIGLDLYLGQDCPYYNMAGLDKYKRYRMHSGKIVSDCMRAWAYTHFAYNDSADNLLNRMIYEGKIQYFMDAVIPYQSDTIKLGYTRQQYGWALQYENRVWKFIIEHQHLYSSNPMDISKYINEAPYTTFFATNSAPQAGVFIGWRIVHAFMKNNPNITLRQLMGMTDAQKILTQSKYKP